MLISIDLKNFAIIDSITVEFKKGLNIITGDTGAGKSVIIDALSLIRGSKASPEYIRSGAEEASIEAVFYVKGNRYLEELLNEYGVDLEENLVIKRIISSEGKNKIIVNGSNITLSMLTSIAESLIDLFGQDENRDLLNVNSHLDYLDMYGTDIDTLREVKDSYMKLGAMKSEISLIENKISDKKQKQDFLKFQCNEIENATLDVHEEEVLILERKILSNSELLNSNISYCYDNLYERDNSICEQLQDMLVKMEESAKIDESLTEHSTLILNSLTNLKEIAYVLRDYKENINDNPSRLDVIQNRLTKINELKRKYNGEISDILKLLNEYKSELEQLDIIDDKLNELRSEYQHQADIFNDLCNRLSHQRKNIALVFSSHVEDELASLGINSARFYTRFGTDEYSSKGTDKVEFYFSSNPDEELKPLVKVASGGELSRIILVIKSLISRNDNKSILIFDEPDSGIGGAVAEAVGKKIKDLSADHQVLCVTHLAQVAKFADNHITVKKEHVNNYTRVIANILTDEQRVDELARMMGGMKITKKTVDAAREMITH